MEFIPRKKSSLKHFTNLFDSYLNTVSGIHPSTFNKIEFRKEESDRETILIAAGGLGLEWSGVASLPQQIGFSIMGLPPSQQIFSPPHESEFPYCYLKWDIEIKKKSLKFEQQNELILKGNLKTFYTCGTYF